MSGPDVYDRYEFGRRANMPEPQVIDIFLSKLCKMLNSATGGENYIETVWGRGYLLRDPDWPLFEIRQSQG